MTDDGITRRGFLELTGATGMAALSSSGLNQQQTQPDRDVDRYGLLMGPSTQRPAPDGAYLSQFDTYQFAYFATDTGAKATITDQENSWNDMPNKITDPTTQVDELRVEDHVSFFNHTFARPEAPDDKNWEYTSADVSKDGSEIELAASTEMSSNQRGNYPPGTEAVPGVAWRVTGTPTAGSAEAGYFNSTNGFGVGEDSTDSYVFVRKASTTEKVYRSNWNGYTPSERVWDSDSPVITRFPHLFYGGGSIKFRALVHSDNVTELQTLHTFTPDNVPNSFNPGPPFDQPNLPIRFKSSSLSGGSLRANAAHYEFGEDDAENRVNGEHFTGVDAGTTGWTPLISWQKRSGWEMVNIKPLKINVFAATNDAKLGLQLDSTLSSTSFSLATNSSSDETAVQVDTAGTLDAVGERRWVGYAAAGQGSSSGPAEAQKLSFNLPATQTVTLVAQGVGGTSTLSGFVSWEEYF